MAPPPQPPQDQTPISTYMMGAMIITALAGVLMLIGDFGGGYWNNYYAGVEGWVYLSAWSTWWGFILIIPMVMAMFYMAYWSSTAMRDASKITISQLNKHFYFSLAIFGFMLFLGIVWAIYAIMEEYDEWWLDVGFYGGIIGGLLAAIIFYLAKKQAMALGYPQ